MVLFFRVLAITSLVSLPAFGSAAQQAFEQLKSLVGTWDGITTRGESFTATYKVLANGNVVVEDYGDEFNVYHLDSDSLIATHYCHNGSKPRMRANNFSREGYVDFTFLDLSGSASAGHAVGVDFVFESTSAIEQRWIWRNQDGTTSITDFFLFRSIAKDQ
jgi:hypothetical protein